MTEEPQDDDGHAHEGLRSAEITPREAPPSKRDTLRKNVSNFASVLEFVTQKREQLMLEALKKLEKEGRIVPRRGSMRTKLLEEMDEQFAKAVIVAGRTNRELVMDPETKQPKKYEGFQAVHYADPELEKLVNRNEFISEIARELAGGKEWKQGDKPEHGYFEFLPEASAITEELTSQIERLVPPSEIGREYGKFGNLLTDVIVQRLMNVGDIDVDRSADRNAAIARKRDLETKEIEAVVTAIVHNTTPLSEKKVQETNVAYQDALEKQMRVSALNETMPRRKDFAYNVGAEVAARDILDIVKTRIPQSRAAA